MLVEDTKLLGKLHNFQGKCCKTVTGLTEKNAILDGCSTVDSKLDYDGIGWYSMVFDGIAWYSMVFCY